MRVLALGGQTVTVNASGVGFLEGGDPSPSGAVVDLVGGPDGAVRRKTYIDIYRSNPYLFACARLYARSISRFPAKLFRPLDDGSQDRIRPGSDSVPASLAAVLRRPGHGRSAASMRHATTIDRLVLGQALWVPERDRYGYFTGIRRVPWRHVVHQEIAGVLRYWDVRTPKVKWLADDVIHFDAGIDADDVLAPSPIATLHATLALYDAVERHLVAYFKNSARPSGHLQVDKSTGRVARQRIREELQKLYSGADNAGRVMITSGEWTSITEAPANSQVVELAKQSREEICSAYGCPPPLIGILDRAIMSNVRELRSHSARDVVGPQVTLMEGDIDAQLLATTPELEDTLIEFEMAAVLRPDLEARAATYKDQRLVRTLNELRQAEGLPRINHPDADMPWMPLNEAPLGDDDKPAGNGGDDDPLWREP